MEVCTSYLNGDEVKGSGIRSDIYYPSIGGKGFLDGDAYMREREE